MSASRRRKTTARKRGKPQADPIDELPELEPMLESDEELDTLEPLEEEDDSPVTVSVTAESEEGFDQRIELTVPEMPKSDVPGAVEGPLRRAVAGAGAELRFHHVLVRFGGDAMVGSAVKDLVAEILAPVKPLSVVVRRGFGDEKVHENALPSVELVVRQVGETFEVAVDPSGCEPEDLATALKPELATLRQNAKGMRFVFTFGELADPGADARGAIGDALADATRVEVAGQLLFDRELEGRVRVTVGGDDATIEVTPGDDEAVTCAALDLVMPGAIGDLGDKAVTLRFADEAPRDAELAKALELLATAAPARIALASGDREPDLLWPRLLRTASRDDQGAVRVEPADRGTDALVAAFRREATGLEAVVAGKRVTVDWPAGFALDAEIEKACITEALGAHRPQAVSCTFGGADREPFVPCPVTFRVESDDLHVIHVDTDTGKPGELVRAIERRLGAVAAELGDKPARIEIVGSGAVSRTMVRTLLDLVGGGGANRVELDDHGEIDVLVPALLSVGDDGAGAVTIAADAAGRDDAQVGLALQRELDAVEIQDGTTCVVEPSALANGVIAAVIGRGASCVTLGGDAPVQVHPALFGQPERDGESLLLTAAPDGDEAGLLAQVDRELAALLDAQGDLAATEVMVVWPGASDRQAEPVARTLEAVLARGPRKLILDDQEGRPAQLFPEIVPEYVTVLGRKDDATPPLLLLGIDQGGDQGDSEEHRAKVLAKLGELAADLDGRRVLLALRDIDHDVRIEDGDALIAAVREVVDAAAQATLVFRGQDPHGRNHFEVVHSTIEGLTVGAIVGDPRPRG